MLTVWGRPNSINVQKVMWTLAELDLEHDRKDVGGAFGGLDTPDYLAMNPNGVIPTLQDGDFTIWESNAIVRYLSEKYDTGSLLPADLETRALAQQWVDWQATTLYPPLRTVFWQLIRTAPEDRDIDVVAQAEAQLIPIFRRLDRALEGQCYLLGEDLTMADIPAGATTYRWLGLDIERPRLPALEDWYACLSERPAFREHVMLPIT